MDFDATVKLLIMYSDFFKCLRKNGNTMKQCYLRRVLNSVFHDMLGIISFSRILLHVDSYNKPLFKKYELARIKRDFSLSPRIRWELRSSGLLRSM